MVRIAVLSFLSFGLGITLGLTLGTKYEKQANRFSKEKRSEASHISEFQASPRKSETPLKTTYEELSEILTAPPVETQVKKGTGTIRGFVLTEDGAPLSGVLVRATMFYEPDASKKRGLSEPPESDIVAEVVRFVKNHQRSISTRCETRTDEKGTFTLTCLVDAEYIVKAYMADYEIEKEDVQRAPTVKPGAVIEFMAKAVFDLTCVVEMPEGTRPETAQIEWKLFSRVSRRRGTTKEWTPEEPTIWLTLGTYTILARSSHQSEEYLSDEHVVTLRTGDGAQKITFQLKRCTGIKGKVIPPPGEIWDSYYVYILESTTDERTDLIRLPHVGKREYARRTDSYAYSFEDLIPGVYLIGVVRRKETPIVIAETVEVIDHMVILDLTIPPPDTSDYVVLWIFGPEDKPVRDARVEMWRRAVGAFGKSRCGNPVEQDDASWWLIHPSDQDSSEDVNDKKYRYFVNVDSMTYGEKEVEFQWGETSEITVEFAEPATLSVTVSGYVGSGLEGFIELTLKHVDLIEGPIYKLRGTFVDNNGTLEMGPFEPGMSELFVFNKRKLYAEKQLLDRIPVTLQSGKNEATVELPDLYSLTVLTEGIPPKEPLYLSQDLRDIGRWKMSEQVKEDSTVEFNCLVTGEYMLEGKGGMMPVQISGSQRIHFEPRPVNAKRVVVKEPTGYLARAGFQTGDLVIGIDGNEFENGNQLESAFRLLKGKKEATMIVLRGELRLGIVIDAQKMTSSSKQGGELIPLAR